MVRIVADATGRVILPVRVIYILFFIVTVAPNKASSESNSNNLKKDDFPKTAPAAYPVFFSDLIVEKLHLAKERTGAKWAKGIYLD